jgi:hypothetical protein
MSSTRYTGFSATIAATMTLVVSLSARSPQLTEDFNQTVAFPSGGLLELRNFSGDVRLRGTTRRDAVIKAVRRGNREELDHIRLEVRTTANGVAIDANRRDPGWDRRRNDIVNTTFDIELPASASLDIDAFSSQLDIRGVSGPLVVKTFSGDIDSVNQSPTTFISASAPARWRAIWTSCATRNAPPSSMMPKPTATGAFRPVVSRRSHPAQPVLDRQDALRRAVGSLTVMSLNECTPKASRTRRCTQTASKLADGPS